MNEMHDYNKIFNHLTIPKPNNFKKYTYVEAVVFSTIIIIIISQSTGFLLVF